MGGSDGFSQGKLLGASGISHFAAELTIQFVAHHLPPNRCHKRAGRAGCRGQPACALRHVMHHPRGLRATLGESSWRTHRVPEHGGKNPQRHSYPLRPRRLRPELHHRPQRRKFAHDKKNTLALPAKLLYSFRSGALWVPDESLASGVRRCALGIQPPHDFSETIHIKNTRNRSPWLVRARCHPSMTRRLVHRFASLFALVTCGGFARLHPNASHPPTGGHRHR